jgi:hypothetical protein
MHVVTMQDLAVEADVAAMWADDEDQDAALAEVLLRQGPGILSSEGTNSCTQL